VENATLYEKQRDQAMKTKANWMVHDHQKYDQMLTECEMAAEMADWKDAVRLFNEFTHDLKLHMHMEDEVLYPLFKQKGADQEDEIIELSEEHENLVRLLRDLVSVIKTKNIDHFMDSLLPLHKAMSEHSQHEETVFQSLENDPILMRRDEIMKQLSDLQKQDGHESRDWGF